MLLTIITGAIAFFVFSAIWYTFLFGRVWAKLMGMPTPEESTEKFDMKKPMIINFVVDLVLVYGFYKIYPIFMTADVPGYQALFFTWLAFAFPIYANAAIWEGKSWKLVLINVAYSVIAFGILSTIMYYMM